MASLVPVSPTKSPNESPRLSDKSPSAIKSVIEKGLSALLTSKVIDSQEFTWSLEIDVDAASVEKCAQFFKSQDARIPEDTDSTDFF